MSMEVRCKYEHRVEERIFYDLIDWCWLLFWNG